MDVIITLSNNCPTDIDKFLKSNNSTTPVDEVIKYINHSFSYKWVLEGSRTFRKNYKHSYNDNYLISRIGSKEWYTGSIATSSINAASIGKLHRIGGPARECDDGHKEWRVNGELHRIDGPAVECANGDKLWYLNNELHRTDGPAVESDEGRKEWWTKDVRL